MYVIRTDDVNDALSQGITYLLREGVEEPSRNGPVIVASGPVVTEYTNPRSRVLYSATRDANPFFHLMECLWFMAGDNDIEFPCYFNSSYGQYSDDGRTMWDAYGHRWRRFFGWDQIEAIVKELTANPASRRCVLTMWDARGTDPDPRLAKDVTAGWDDFYVATHGGKAVPCNTHCYVDTRGGQLNLTVCNRSNDIVFGCYGANAVHMSFLAEYLAMRLNVLVGTYYQISNNFHSYTNVFDRSKLERMAHESNTVGALPDISPRLELGFDSDLVTFMAWARVVMRSTNQDSVALNVPDLKTEFVMATVVPIFLSWVYRKWKDPYSMNLCLDGIAGADWKRACAEWVERRRKG